VRCETCRFWVPCVDENCDDNDETMAAGREPNSGECRHHAPTRILADSPTALKKCTHAAGNNEPDDDMEFAGTRAVFPLTLFNVWCGDYQPQPEEPM
jgi:hypothetical protein